MTIAQRGRPKILHPVRTEYGKAIRKDYEAHRVSEKRRFMQQYEPRADGITNTITTVLKDNLCVAKVVRNMETENISGDLEPLCEIYAADENDRPRDANGKTLDDYLYTAKDGEQYGIFKLSPRECGRLMGVSDSDIDKMTAVNSNSQLYKQFGNSIVVAVLVGIFSQLNIQGITPWNNRTTADRYKMIEGE